MARARPTETTAVLTIESVGVRGDGIAHHEGKPVYVPFTAPGDRVRVALAAPRGEGRAGRLLELLAPGERIVPVCPHFGTCGGCALQHLSEDAYVAAKEGQLRHALAAHGLADAEVLPLRRLPPAARRRARFALHPPRGKAAPAQVGFHARASHHVVDMHACAVLHPALFALVEPLRRLAGQWLRGSAGAATATLTEAGVDLLLDLPHTPDLAALEALASFAASQDLARLAWRVGERGEATPVALRRPARVTFGGVAVDVPEDAFLQASAEADAALTEAVLAGAGDGASVADLFAGIGTFSFALARRAQVHAVEGWASAAAALSAAASNAGLAGRVTVERRDLERRPLAGEELRRFDAVVLDPPRAGAKAQSAALAEAAVPRVVMVSCNPATFARDARRLVDGGYCLLSVQPFDAFVWSPHLELVARFDHA